MTEIEAMERAAAEAGLAYRRHVYTLWHDKPIARELQARYFAALDALERAQKAERARMRQSQNARISK
jgi:hypothetical protein